MSKIFQSWLKVVDILEHDGHLLFGNFEILRGGSDERIEYTYKRLMSAMDTLLKMSFFFASMQMHALEDMV
jgi:hypothetical protein